jgi:vacuolar protein sorting-associated protein VTA1
VPGISQQLPETLDAEETTRAKKHAKFAISALDYDDLDTARMELLRALAVLGVNVSL